MISLFSVVELSPYPEPERANCHTGQGAPHSPTRIEGAGEKRGDRLWENRANDDEPAIVLASFFWRFPERAR